MIEIPWSDLEVGFIGVFALLGLVLLGVGYLRRATTSAPGGSSDGE